MQLLAKAQFDESVSSNDSKIIRRSKNGNKNGNRGNGDPQ